MPITPIVFHNEMMRSVLAIIAVASDTVSPYVRCGGREGCRPPGSLYRLTFVIDHLIDRSTRQPPYQLYRWPKCVSDFQWSRRNSLRGRRAAEKRLATNGDCLSVGGHIAFTRRSASSRRDAAEAAWLAAAVVVVTSATSCGQSASTVNLMAAAQLTTVRWTNRWRHAGQLSRRRRSASLSFSLSVSCRFVDVVLVAAARP